MSRTLTAESDANVVLDQERDTFCPQQEPQGGGYE